MQAYRWIVAKLTVWMHFGLAYTILTIYIWFYANDGYVRYIPKRQRFRNKMIAYLAYLKAWLKYTWRRKIQLKTTHWMKRWKHMKLIQKHWNKFSEGDYHTILAEEAILAKQAAANPKRHTFIVDSDSKAIGIDNRASAFISGDITDFQGPLIDTNKVVKGFGGTRVTGVKRGTAVIRIEDDEGRTHRVRLKDSYYVQGSKDRLLSPQHFAQEMRRQTKDKHGKSRSVTDADTVTLEWGAGYIRTIPLDPATNVEMAPGDLAGTLALCIANGK